MKDFQEFTPYAQVTETLHSWQTIEYQVQKKSYLFAEVQKRCLNQLKHLHVQDSHKQWLSAAQAYAKIPEVEVDSESLQREVDTIKELPEQAR